MSIPYEVYPRACGGTPACYGVHDFRGLWGLSPRVRGNHSRYLQGFHRLARVYPAPCGGTTGARRPGIPSTALGSIPARAGEPPSPGGQALVGLA